MKCSLRLRTMLLWLVSLWANAHFLCLQGADLEATLPEPEREFRGGWVATVSNIDWPSTKGLPVEQQKKELLAILNRAVQLRLNAIILQVRPACDAIYASKLEPWSEYLTGEMGRPPEPYYDPLEFAISEAHQRGLELHAWFNPYRARILASRSPTSGTHISKTHPDWARKYGSYLWLDPGEPGVQDHNINVITDVVKRYDIDGIHFDDYFYPYQERDESGKILDFPDEPSWKRYKQEGGPLERNDWRRENVNMFIKRLYKSIKDEKPWVQLGISPFGIWKTGAPAGTRGLNAFEILYADSRKWLAEGWVDYFAPQLYWNVDQKEQSYPVLLKWWVEQNVKKRNLWPGISTARVGNTRGPEEIANQIFLTRKQPGATGNIHWSFKSLAQNRKGISDLLSKEVYTTPALVPASPWLSDARPPKVTIDGRQFESRIRLRWRLPVEEKIWLWVLQKRIANKWHTEILPGELRAYIFESDDPGAIADAVAIRAINHYGNLAPPAILEIEKPTAK